MGTGKEQHITITSSTNMSKEDIDKAVKEAQQFAAEDARKKEEVETRNQGEQLVYQTEKTLEELGGKIDASDRATLDTALNKLKDALKGDNTEAIKTASDELSKAFYPITEKLYQQANPQGQPGGPDMGGAGFGGQSGPADDGVVDADYTVVDDDPQ
ncbi:MAG: Hsp70 family protein, partial [Oscillospiraceae bacterium]|nr:Hsp70 family protein [Oscillospiraceae bacterium]